MAHHFENILQEVHEGIVVQAYAEAASPVGNSNYTRYNWLEEEGMVKVPPVGFEAEKYDVVHTHSTVVDPDKTK